ncbi:MAG: hypothetical protein HY323_14770 [Betaproteobacteria bacterium]|nr:hypothetical protein [Betaproteobacteria bacterium]
MAGSMVVLDPVAPERNEQQQSRRALDGLTGKVVGFIDNGKPNFNHLVDDLAELLVSKHGVASVVKHRKRGSVPVPDAVLKELSAQCDAVITGSGD